MNRTGQLIGMAGAVMSAQQALQLARTGHASKDASALVIGATLRLDADSALEVYGGREAIRPALKVLRDFMHAKERDPVLVRTLIVLLQLERRFTARRDVAAKVAEGVRAIAAGKRGELDVIRAVVETTREELDVTVDELGALYAATISKLTPRIMIPGDPQLLARPAVVTAVRAHLMAALRGAVLWRQMGGSRIGLLLGWNALRSECTRLLAAA